MAVFPSGAHALVLQNSSLFVIPKLKGKHEANTDDRVVHPQGIMGLESKEDTSLGNTGWDLDEAWKQ